MSNKVIGFINNLESINFSEAPKKVAKKLIEKEAKKENLSIVETSEVVKQLLKD